MKIYDVINTVGKRRRLIAKDKDQAIDISLSFRHVINPEKAEIEDMTDNLVSDPVHKDKILKLLSRNKQGLIVLSLPITSWVGGFIMIEIEKINDKWKVVKK